MDAQPALIARYHMPARGWRETRMYDGRVHIVLPTEPSPELVSWCEAQPNVLATEVGTITPTSLAIYMKDLGTRDYAAQDHMREFLRNLGEWLGQNVQPEMVTTFRSQLEQLRLLGPPAYTPEMQFLTEVNRRPGDTFYEMQPDDTSFAGRLTPAPTVLAERKPYPIRRWRMRSDTPMWRTWLRQSARWIGWYLVGLVSLVVLPPLRIVAMVTLLRKARRHRR